MEVMGSDLLKRLICLEFLTAKADSPRLEPTFLIRKYASSAKISQAGTIIP
jgi:hypothetical protein